MMPVVALREVAAAPWGRPLLDNISLAVNPGIVLGILGPNGAGKSSLLHVIGGDIPAIAGQLQLGGRSLAEWTLRERARSVAMLGQNTVLNFPFTVEEVVLLARIPHSSGAARDRDIVAEVMAATDTECLRGRHYTALSGGEKQRVQLARALAQVWRADDSEVRLLLLDEPTSALDPAHQQLVTRCVRHLAGEGCAVVVVMHDCNRLAELADEITVLADGRQVTTGAPEVVLTPAMFASVFAVSTLIERHPVTGLPLVVFR
jgi:iron complex transport system ATP-binding protein